MTNKQDRSWQQAVLECKQCHHPFLECTCFVGMGGPCVLHIDQATQVITTVTLCSDVVLLTQHRAEGASETLLFGESDFTEVAENWLASVLEREGDDDDEHTHHFIAGLDQRYLVCTCGVAKMRSSA